MLPSLKKKKKSLSGAMYIGQVVAQALGRGMHFGSLCLLCHARRCIHPYSKKPFQTFRRRECHGGDGDGNGQ